MSTKPSILFIHKNFPAQFGGLATWLAGQGWDVVFATEREVVSNPGFRVVRYMPHRDVTKHVHPYLASTERAVIAGQGFARCAAALAGEGYAPDIVMAHSGWGVGTFAKDVWPNAKFVAFAEWWYNWPAVDRSPYDAPVVEPLDKRARTRVRNTPMLLDLMAADAIWCPTRFQAAQFPQIWRERMTIVHDGIPTDVNSPGPRDSEFLETLGIPADAEIVTYVARGMEPQRGFPEMIHAACKLMASRPKLHVIVVGEDRVAYGDRNFVKSWKEKLLSEVSFDTTRLHFTGLVSRPDLVKIYRSSDVHLYLSVPFVLSWSALEAMSCGCQVVAVKNAATQEFMSNGRTAWLVEPYAADELVSAMESGLTAAKVAREIGQSAREFVVESLDAATVIFPKKMRILSGLLNST